MPWPLNPTCHDGAWRFAAADATHWRQGTGDRDYRTCSYCGSMHPEDLMRAVSAGARVGGSDWKYGWPHKYYIEGGGITWGKWYNEHLMDLDDESFIVVAEMLARSAHIQFFKKDGKLMYRSPTPGFQP